MERKPLDATAIGIMVVLTALWGAQQVAIKLAAEDVSLVMQGGIRSVVATALLWLWARQQGIALFGRDGTLAAGLCAGLLFAGEFVFIYAGLAHTTASRMVVFVYIAPVVVALGLHALIPAERLAPRQWAGVLLAFAGVVVAFHEGFTAGRGTWAGDLCGIVAGVLWALTTVLLRATRLAHVTATKALFYQHAVTALVMPLASLALGEPGVVRLGALALGSLVFQSVVVAFASFLLWFWLLTRYLAARISVLAFMTPLWGVLFGTLILGDPVGPAYLAAALLVGAGIVLVNLKRA